ncbi:hypothetical protein [Bacteroides nordii]|uniref:hypothetical protein n=1 Tax=Bacteroides nordii TaxID=291645 RepID=UPI003AF5B5D4
MKEESKLIELFKKYPGIAARIRRSFAYHYDQIQREIESEVATINKDDAATIIQEQEKYKPLIMEKFQHYKDNFDEEEHAEEIDYYLNFLEEPETLYTFTEKTINLFKSFIHEN